MLASNSPASATSAPEGVHHPKHYDSGASDDGRVLLPALGFTSSDLNLECIAAMEKIEHRWLANSFHLGSAVKYIWRAGVKPDQPKLKDLQKALWYCDRLAAWELSPLPVMRNRRFSIFHTRLQYAVKMAELYSPKKPGDIPTQLQRQVLG